MFGKVTNDVLRATNRAQEPRSYGPGISESVLNPTLAGLVLDPGKQPDSGAPLSKVQKLDDPAYKVPPAPKLPPKPPLFNTRRLILAFASIAIASAIIFGTRELITRYEQSVAAAKQVHSANSPTKFETVPPNEAEQIAEIVSLTTQLLQQRYPESMARRAVHPKDHGCVKAAFTINSDIPENYRVGVFATPAKTYDTWIRFSNATPVVGPDIDKVTGPPSRGMAIKLMGVEGDTLLGDPSAKTQDFLLINLPGFAFPNVAEYLEVTKIQFANNDDISTFFTPPLSPERLKTVAIVQRLKQTKLGNPLDSRYFSASPFLFGADRVAKFGVTPRNPENTPVPEGPSVNYLREAMKKSLDVATGKSAVFDFQVQLRTNDGLPIEDATAEWPEATAPFQCRDDYDRAAEFR